MYVGGTTAAGVPD